MMMTAMIRIILLDSAKNPLMNVNFFDLGTALAENFDFQILHFTFLILHSLPTPPRSASAK